MVKRPSRKQQAAEGRRVPVLCSRLLRQAHWLSKLALLTNLGLIVSVLTGCDLSPLETATPVSSRPAPAFVSVLATPSTTPRPPLPAPVGTVPVQVSLNITDAWGSQVLGQIRHISDHLIGADTIVPSSIAPDGSFLLVGAAPPLPKGDSTRPEKPTKLLTIDIPSLHPHDITTPAKVELIPYSAYADEHWIVWAQSPVEPGFFSDWELYAYNRGNGAIKQLAKAAHNKDGMPARGSDGSPAIDHGTVVWAEAVADLGQPYQNTIKAADLATGQVRTLSTSGFAPRLSWPYAAWLELRNPPAARDSQATQAQSTAVIIVLDLQHGTKTELVKPDRPVEFALYRDSIAWIGTKRDRITLTNIAETVVQALPLGSPSTGFEQLTMNDRLVTWLGTEAVQVWDRRKNAVVTLLPHGPSISQFLTNNYLVWINRTEFSPGAATDINILDTAKLP